MTIPRLMALTAHWRQFPPVHITLAAFVGAGKQESKPTPKPDQPQQSDEMAELLGMLSPG